MEQRLEKPLEVRQIPAFVDQQKLDDDLNSLIRLAKETGAADAAVIHAGDVIINREIKAKADGDNGFPSIHWPLSYPKDNVEEALGAYETGLFFHVTSEEDMVRCGGGPISDENHRALYFKVSDIVSRVESTAFYMGYHLVLGFAAGNCRSIFCADEKRCGAMIKGRQCIHPYKGRPSLEAIGINADALAKKANFNLPKNNLNPLLAGLVMVV